MDDFLWKAGPRTSSAPAHFGATRLPILTAAYPQGHYDRGQRPVRSAHFCTSGQFHAGRPPTVHEGSGMSPRCRQMSTVGRLTPSRSATSGMPTGSQFFMGVTVEKVLTDCKGCVDNHYMTTATAAETTTLRQLVSLFDEAKGDHEALADVRRQISAQIDAFIAGLAAAGVDTEALLDEVYA